jgi:hypothetical protein
VRTLDGAGLDIHLLASAIEKPTNGGALSQDEMQRFYDAGFTDGLRHAEDAQHGPGKFKNFGGTPSWEEIAGAIGTAIVSTTGTPVH